VCNVCCLDYAEAPNPKKSTLKERSSDMLLLQLNSPFSITDGLYGGK
jgi:hypothetical protein